MRKIGVILLVFIMVLGLMGCKENNNFEEIDAQLQGEWYVVTDHYIRTFVFEDGEYESVLVNEIGTNDYSGTYEIRGDGIYTEDTKEPFLTYSYDKSAGTVKYYFNGELLCKP